MKGAGTGILFLLTTAISLAACTAAVQPKEDAGAKPVSAEEYPRTVAILPFGNDTDELTISPQVRKSFSNHFSSKPFMKIDPSVVDEKTVQLEKTSGKNIFDLPPADMAKAVGADGLIYGRVTDYKKVYAVAYSQMGVEAEVWLVNASTGKELWRFKEAVRYHEGGASLSPIGFVMTAVSTAMNLREMQQVRVVNELGWKLNEKIPAPPGMKMEAKPLIRNVLSNAREGPFGKGAVFKAAMEGEAGLVGMYDIAGLKKGLIMKEVKDGEYLGEFLPSPGDNIKDAPVTVYLRRPTGEESSWSDISGFLTIDTAPPPQVEGLLARAFVERIELTWKKAAAPDLKAYNVLRSEKPLSGYIEIAAVEEEKFTDSGAKPGAAYYYRVSSVDEAKNTGEPAEPVKASLREKEPVLLTGEITKDRTLPAGDYIVKDSVTVAKGVILTLEAGSRLLFEKDASMTAYGNITARGLKDEFIELMPKTEGVPWNGVTVEGSEAVLSFVKITGAGTALKLINSPSLLKDIILDGNSIGLHSIGAPSPKISNATIWHSPVGVLIESSQAEMTASNVTQNKLGVKIVKSTPAVKSNNIYANEVNMESTDESFDSSGNFFGTTVFEEMRFKGAVKALTVLDGKYPGGKPVAPALDPYALLTPEEKKAKAAEAAIAAGKFFREKNFGKAAERFEEAIKLDESPAGYYYLALSYQGMEDKDNALAVLKRGAKKYPLDSNILKAYGLLLYELEKNDEAKSVIKEAARLNPGDRQLKFILERLEGNR
ncbi:MAG: DUF799 family lipoprotein [Deltaproteobacteria bacterium]|nr:DUF799 family lipoprotein [Deltaproteobacteria bacterium]